MLQLVKLTDGNYPLLAEMMDEWTASKERIVPYVLVTADYKKREEYISRINTSGDKFGFVADSTYFGYDDEENIFVGAVNIRHRLNKQLLLNGGHIGDGVRPSMRNRGMASKMIALALEKCREMNIDKVLMVCDKTNTASEKTIIKNKGVLENEVDCEGVVYLRYWIDNSAAL